jgi:hypothetical protein
MQTRTVNLPALALALLVAGGTASVARSVAAGEVKLDGTWKMVVLAFGDDEFAIVKLSQQDSKITGTVVDAQEMLLGKSEVKEAEQKGDQLTVALNGTAGQTVFQGKIQQDGPKAGEILGIVNFHGELYPARLESTNATKVGPHVQSPLIAKYIAAMNEKDSKSKIKKLEELTEGNHGAPNNQLLFSALLSLAEEAGLDSDRVGGMIKRWSEEAKPYGDGWVKEVKFKALKAIGASKKFAKLGVELATEADKGTSEAPVERKAAIVELLALAARNSGMEELAKDAEARHAKLDTMLDEEYHKNVPPFKPTPYGGRKDTKAGQVVLMELFTGAQCPPCVAADVAFDALLSTYKPADFIGLQYHLHIPGPDPLTNTDSVARQEYYGTKVQGTPSTFFNGRSQAGGGGPMGSSQTKYKEYREIVDKILEAPKNAKITASATRAGDQIKIIASAQVTENQDGQTAVPDGEKAKEKKEKSKRMLRLALTEESIHYVGGNKLRFHHHVVRAFPGGAQGKELAGGTGKVELALSLADLKRGLETYLSDHAKTGAFPKLLPEIKLKDLALVAFVQDDADQSILQAISVPVKEATP